MPRRITRRYVPYGLSLPCRRLDEKHTASALPIDRRDPSPLPRPRAKLAQDTRDEPLEFLVPPVLGPILLPMLLEDVAQVAGLEVAQCYCWFRRHGVLIVER